MRNVSITGLETIQTSPFHSHPPIAWNSLGFCGLKGIGLGGIGNLEMRGPLLFNNASREWFADSAPTFRRQVTCVPVGGVDLIIGIIALRHVAQPPTSVLLASLAKQMDISETPEAGPLHCSVLIWATPGCLATKKRGKSLALMNLVWSRRTTLRISVPSYCRSDAVGDRKKAEGTEGDSDEQSNCLLCRRIWGR
jgi:hypothetical protein